MEISIRLTAVSLSFAVATAASAQLFLGQTVLGTANLSGAGNPSNPTPSPGGGSGGTVAPVFSLSPGMGRTLTFATVTGMASMSTGISTVPDGVLSNGAAPFGLTFNVSAYDGISGIRLSAGSGFLAGVFLGVGYPSGAPADLAFSNANGTGGTATSFATLSPEIGQSFFIGDGLTGTGSGSTQVFSVPDGATRLYLGFLDAGGYNGAPGQFGDNSGSLTANFAVTPEPLSFFVLGTGVTVALRRKKR